MTHGILVPCGSGTLAGGGQQHGRVHLMAWHPSIWQLARHTALFLELVLALLGSFTLGGFLNLCSAGFIVMAWPPFSIMMKSYNNSFCIPTIVQRPGLLCEVIFLHANFFQGEQKHIFTFYVIPPHCYDTGSWNTSSSKTRTYLFYIVNIMGVDVLVT